jgi:hypothetical protein
MQEIINTLVTQAYIENKLKGMLTADVKDQKLEDMKTVIREEVTKEVMKEVDVT